MDNAKLREAAYYCQNAAQKWPCSKLNPHRHSYNNPCTEGR